MISEVVKGKTVDEVAALGRDDVLEELGIPLSPIRLKCALLSVSVLKVALGRTPGAATARSSGDRVGPVDAIPEGGSRSSSQGRSSSGSTASTARCTRSRIAAATTTARCARASGRGSA